MVRIFCKCTSLLPEGEKWNGVVGGGGQTGQQSRQSEADRRHTQMHAHTQGDINTLLQEPIIRDIQEGSW